MPRETSGKRKGKKASTKKGKKAMLENYQRHFDAEICTPMLLRFASLLSVAPAVIKRVSGRWRGMNGRQEIRVIPEGCVRLPRDECPDVIMEFLHLYGQKQMSGKIISLDMSEMKMGDIQLRRGCVLEDEFKFKWSKFMKDKDYLLSDPFMSVSQLTDIIRELEDDPVPSSDAFVPCNEEEDEKMKEGGLHEKEEDESGEMNEEERNEMTEEIWIQPSTSMLEWLHGTFEL